MLDFIIYDNACNLLEYQYTLNLKLESSHYASDRNCPPMSDTSSHLLGDYSEMEVIENYLNVYDSKRY